MELDWQTSIFAHSSGRTGGNVIIFGVDMSSSTKTDNRKRDILILGKGSTQTLEHNIAWRKNLFN